MLYEYCIPAYYGSGDWHTIEAFDEEAAAKKAAARFNEDGEYSLMRDHGQEYILVREDEDTPSKIFRISAEPSIDYYADNIDEVRCKHCNKNLKRRIILGKSYQRDGKDFCTHKCWELYYKNWYAEYKANLEK